MQINLQLQCEQALIAQLFHKFASLCEVLLQSKCVLTKKLNVRNFRQTKKEKKEKNSRLVNKKVISRRAGDFPLMKDYYEIAYARFRAWIRNRIPKIPAGSSTPI